MTGHDATATPSHQINQRAVASDFRNSTPRTGQKCTQPKHKLWIGANQVGTRDAHRCLLLEAECRIREHVRLAPARQQRCVVAQKNARTVHKELGVGTVNVPPSGQLKRSQHQTLYKHTLGRGASDLCGIVPAVKRRQMHRICSICRGIGGTSSGGSRGSGGSGGSGCGRIA